MTTSTITIENNVGKVIDFKLNGKLVAVIGLSGGLTFLKNAKLSWQEADAIEDACREYHKSNCKLELA